jgi:DNA adenine methylase
MRPFLRWAGGKRWLTRNSSVALPASSRLIEPFLGGGALFFSRFWNSAVLADVNRFLINAYVWMKNDHSGLFDLLIDHFNLHSKDYYYEIRARLGASTRQDAADFIYLNRACFNGLFRVNLSGRFNVPIGNKLYELRDRTEFDDWAARLKRCEIRLADFEETIGACGEGDFIFADPPYTVNHNSNGFIEYNEKIFSWDDQVRLHACLLSASSRGAQFALTNADHSTVRELYEGCALQTVERGSEMAGRIGARGRTTEVVITSFATGAAAQTEFEGNDGDTVNYSDTAPNSHAPSADLRRDDEGEFTCPVSTAPAPQ